MSAVIIVKKIRRTARDYGWRTCVAKMSAGVLSILYEKRVYRVYRIGVQAKDWRWPEQSRFQFRLVEASDSDTIRQIENIAEWLSGEVALKISEGGFCCVACDGPRVVGFNLVNLNRMVIPLLNLIRALKPGDAWSEHIAVHEAYRRLRLAGQIRSCVLAELKRRGFKNFYGGTLVSNTASLLLARSVGFQEIADITYRNLLGRRLYKVRPVRQ